MIHIFKVIINLIIGIKKKLFTSVPNPYKTIGINWLQLRLIKNLPENKINTIKLWGKDFTCFGKNELIHGIDEIFLGEIYKTDLPINAKIIDCGAHIGMSVIYFKRICLTASIIAFEPDKDNFNLLKKNIESFNLKDIELHEEAVWVENTELNFNSDGNMSSKIELNKLGKDLSKVKAIRLADLINFKIHFLKIDIEGAEYQVLKDITPKLYYVDNLFIEYHGKFSQNNELNEILKILTDNKFSYYIKEATKIYSTPFFRNNKINEYDLQLNICAFKL